MSGDHNEYQKDKSYLDQKPRMKGLRWHVKPDGDDLLVCFDYAVKPEDEYVRFVRAGQQSDFECPRCGHCCYVDDDDTSQERINETTKQEQEPWAWANSLDFDDDDIEIIPARAKGKLGTSNCDIPLYTAPPKQWVGLTDGEIHDMNGYEEDRRMYRFARAIEAKLKEKNHG